MNKGRATINTAVYSAAHFVTDFSCAFLIFAFVHDTGELPLKLLLYNFCAFALQMPIGLIADKLNRNGFVTSLGCVLVALACVLARFPYAAVIVAGFGNALFHVGGGLEVMNSCASRFASLGVFVAPGALGLFLGTLAGKSGQEYYLPTIALLIIFAVATYSVARLTHGGLKSKNVPLSLAGLRTPKAIAALVCLFAVVVLRSYAGMLFSFPWKTGTTAVIFVLGVVLGKALGGIISDKMGLTATSCASLSAAAVLFLFSDNAVCGIIAVFLFNMTMPLTLGICAKLLNGAKGFAFGILTFALFIGCLPEFTGYTPVFTGGMAYCAICAASIALLLTGIRLSGGKSHV